jgi:LacI family transcriptional regulator, galactose operon repressor
VILGEARYSSFAGRLEGYRMALREAGVSLDESLVVEAGLHAVNARRAAATLLRAHANVTAVLATNGPMAMAVVRYLREQSRRVPEDFSLVAWDDAAWMDMVTPGITTVYQPTKEMGLEAARLLVERLAGLAGPPTRRRLPTRLVLRESTAPPQVPQ